MKNVFNLKICPKCGKIVFFHENICPYCNTGMHDLEYKIDSTFISDIDKYIDEIYKQYYKKYLYDKKAWKYREKMDLKEIKSHGKMVWDKNLKTNIKVCPKCGDIVTNNYLSDSNSCVHCETEYVEINISGFDYYYPSLKGEGYIINKIKSEINNLGLDIDVILNSKGNINSLPRGLFLELFEMPMQILDANRRIKEIFMNYIPIVNSHCLAIENNINEKDILELSYVVNHIQNTLRGQRFIGQEKIVNFLTLMFIDIEKHYFNSISLA